MVIPDLAWAILLMVVGCALVVLEVFIPSGGIISILAVVAFVSSLVIGFWESPTTGPTTGLILAAVEVLLVPILIATAFKYWPRTRMGKAFLGELQTDKEVLPEDPRRTLLGRVGVARSKMLPSGAVEVDGQMIDAMTQGQAIEPGAYVVVVEVRGNRVIVRPAGADQRPGNQSAQDIKDILSRPIDELGIDSLGDPLAEVLMQKPILETRRLSLREMTWDDLDFIATMLADPLVMRHYPKLHTRDEAEAWLQKMIDRYREDGHALWLVETQSDRRSIGQVGLLRQHVDGVDEPEIGYLIHAPYWGQGYAVEAAAAVREYAFHTLDGERVISLIRPANIPSQRVALRLGMKPEKLTKFRDLDTLVYSLAREGGAAKP